MKKVGIAFDKASARTFDADGRMHVAQTNISKANVCPYYGREIPGYDALGLDANKVYRLYRDPDELAKGASTFNNIQLMRKHVQVGADDPKKEDIVGSIGSDVVFEQPYLKASLCVWDAEAIAMIEAEQLDELSAGYRYKAVMTPGKTPEGEDYDGVMTEIQGNHLALVETGRAGPDVIVADSNPFKPSKEAAAMKKTLLGYALLGALSGLSPKIAQDSSLPKLVGEAVKKTFDKKAVRTALIAMDGELDPTKADEIIDAVLGVEDNPEPTEPPKPVAKDESEHTKIIDFLKTKGLDAPALEAVGEMLRTLTTPAQDESALMKPEEVTAAMDSALEKQSKELSAKFQALDKAKAAVRPVVGDVIGMDSAESVYRFTLDQMKVEHKDTPAAGLANLFAVAQSASAKPAPTNQIAKDAASLPSIKGLDRFATI